MSRIFFFFFLFSFARGSAQCPSSVSIDSSGNCIGSALHVSTPGNFAKIEWYLGNTLVKTALATAGSSSGITVAGGNGFGPAANQFEAPYGIWFDATGNLYVSDAYNSRVQQWAPGATGGITVAGGNGMGTAANQLWQPEGIFVDAQGNLYVTDPLNFRVQKYPSGSNSSTNGITVAGGNGNGSALNQISGPIGVFVDVAGNVYVADAPNDRIVKWAPGATAGVVVAGGNGQGASANQLDNPWGVFVDQSGNIDIADRANARIQQWAPGATSGITVAGGNGFGTAANQLAYPEAIFVDAAGNIYVSDVGNFRIQKWTPGATTGVTVAGGNGQGSAANQLDNPNEIYVDASGNIYIADESNERVQKWAQSTIYTTYLTTSAGTYHAVVTDQNGCVMTSNDILINTSVIPSVSISSTLTSVSPCTPVTFTATPVNGGPAPTYQWQVNGINTGNGLSTFTRNNWQGGDVVRCMMNSNSACAIPQQATSNLISLVVSNPKPITLAAKGGNCLGDTLFINTGDSLVKIVWYQDNTPVDTVYAVDTAYSVHTVAGGNGFGPGANQLFGPSDVYLDGSGNLFISDYYNNRIEVWAPGATSGVMVAGSPGIGNGPAQLNMPYGVFVDALGNEYVADYGNSRIQKFPPGSNLGVTVAGGNGAGSNADQLNQPTGVFVDAAGNIYIADHTNNRVQKWAPGATSGVTVAGGFSAYGPGPDQLETPYNVFVDSKGNVYVTDLNNDRIQMWAPGATSGITVAGGNGRGSGANQLVAPTGVFVDSLGNIYVADWGNNRVQKWAPGATSGVTVAGGNGQGSGANQLYEPSNIYVDAHGNIYIADFGNNRIQEWSPKTVIDSTYKPLAPGTYTAVITNVNGCTITTNAVDVYANTVPVIQIQESPATICLNAGIHNFSATIQHGGTAPVYQWAINGIATGSNSSTYSSANLKNGDQLSCRLTSNQTCAIPATVNSNSLVISVPSVKPVSLRNSGKNCSGDTLSVSTLDSIAQISWYKDGSLVRTATASPVASTGITIAGGNGFGSAANQFFSPQSVYLDGKGNVYVSDAVNNRVQMFPPGSTSATNGITVAGGNGNGSAANQLANPEGIFVDPAGNIYIADYGNNRIQEWLAGASSGITVAGGNGPGPAANQLNSPMDVFVDASGNIYVADWLNQRIQEWAPGANSGVTVAGGNGAGTGPDQFNGPVYVFVDPAGNIFVTDRTNDRVQKWAPGATTGVTVAGGNGIGTANNQITAPFGIFVDAGGNLYVADYDNWRILKFPPGSTSATNGTVVAGGNNHGAAANQFDGPASVYVDATGNIYVVDLNNERVQKWSQAQSIDTTFIANSPGTYFAEVTNRNGCVSTTNSLSIKPALVPQTTISASAQSVCAGMPQTFSAIPSNGGTTPVFQWKINGRDTGVNSPNLTVTNPNNGDLVFCTMQSNAVCVTKPIDTSNSIQISVNPVVIPSVQITGSKQTICSGESIQFTALVQNGGTQPVLQWKINGQNVGGNTALFSTSTLQDGDLVTCEVTGNAPCTSPAAVVSNALLLTVINRANSSVSLSASGTAFCSGTEITLLATASNIIGPLNYQWLVNGQPAGTNTNSFVSSQFQDGDQVSCVVTGSLTCNLATSDTVTLIVYPLPVIPPNQTFTISRAHSLELDPVISGDVQSYSWSPPVGLSNVSIRNPLANPSHTTEYQLQIISSKGCVATGNITVKVFSEIRIPNAFTPNGDGKNDVFYVIGGPQGSLIKEFAVFNRWGQCVFQKHKVLPDDPAYGWNGTFNGELAPGGTYVYFVNITLQDGTSQLFKGTVILLR